MSFPPKREELTKTFSESLNLALDRAGYRSGHGRASDLAKLLGVSSTAASKYLGGKMTANPAVLLQLSNTLGVSIDFLLGRSVDALPTSIPSSLLKVPLLTGHSAELAIPQHLLTERLASRISFAFPIPSEDNICCPDATHFLFSEVSSLENGALYLVRVDSRARLARMKASPVRDPQRVVVDFGKQDIQIHNWSDLRFDDEQPKPKLRVLGMAIARCHVTMVVDEVRPIDEP